MPYLTVYVMCMWYLLSWGPYGLPHGCSKCAFAVFIHVLLNVVICVMARNASVRYVSTSQCTTIYTAFPSSCYDHIYMHKYVRGNVAVQAVCSVLCFACVARMV